MDNTERLRRLAAYSRATEGEILEGAVGGDRYEPPKWLVEEMGAEPATRGYAALKKLHKGKDVPKQDVVVLEAVIHRTKRPVLDVQDNAYAKAHGIWRDLDRDEARTRLQPLLPSVCRIEIPDHPQADFAGSGFIVGDGLVMTNRHVAQVFASGLGCRGVVIHDGQKVGVDFVRERNRTGSEYVDVERVEMIHPYWDMALLRVSSLAGRSPLRLLAVPPGDLKGRRVIVVGFPAFSWAHPLDVQKDIFKDVFDVKRVQPGFAGDDTYRILGMDEAMAHDASTLGGNSGSAVIDIDEGAVVALHFAGHYLLRNYAVPMFELARDPKVTKGAGLEFDGDVPSDRPSWLSRWTAVERPDNGSTPAAAGNEDDDEGEDAAAARTSGGGAMLSADGSVSLTIPLQISVRLGQPQIGHGTRADAVPPGPAVVEAPKSYKIQRRLPYSNRRGYDPSFLGDELEVELPWLSDEQYADVAFNREATSNRKALPYHTFSIVMCKRRRLAYYTASNIDGSKKKIIRRSTFSDRWFRDNRIGKDEQVENELYAGNPLDRGHLVRRLDATWGSSWAAASHAHDDTFHWTNCSPQHMDFNRQEGPWAELENYLLDNAHDRKMRICVFTGPVFRGDDPPYETTKGNEIQLPREFWKVVAMIRKDGRPSVTGYLVTQRKLLADMGVEAPFQFGPFKTFQRSLTALEKLTGLTFHGLKAHDPLGASAEGVEGIEADARELTDAGAITL